MSFDLDWQAFWEQNRKALATRNLTTRVPVDLFLPGDWICDLLALDNASYYAEYRYQQDGRQRCSEQTERELGVRIPPMVDFGVVMDASIYGGRVNYESNATPTLEPVVREPADAKALMKRMENVDLLGQGLVPKYLEWRERIRTEFGTGLACGDSIKGCATTLGQLCGVTNFMTWIAIEPETIALLAECWRDTSRRYLRLLHVATGMREDRPGLSFASDLTGLLSPDLYRGPLMDAESALYHEFAPSVGDRRYYHADFRMLHHLDALHAMGVNEVNIDPYADPAAIHARLPDAVIFGQIPPTRALLNGTPEDVVECVRRDIGQARGRLVVSPAGSINPGTSFEHLRAMCWAAATHGGER